MKEVKYIVLKDEDDKECLFIFSDRFIHSEIC